MWLATTLLYREWLQFRLKLKLGSTGNAMRLQLNPDIAAHSLLRDVRIMSGAGVVLEMEFDEMAC